MQRRLRALEHDHLAGPEGDEAGADLAADRAAAAGDEDALAADERGEPLAVDLDRVAQQEVLDLERRELGVAHAFAEARDAHERQPEPAGARDELLGMRLGGQRRGGRDETADLDLAVLEVLHDALDVAEGAEHRNAADGLPALGRARREDAARVQLLHRSELDRAQDDLDVGGAAEEQRRGRRLAGDGVAGAGELQVADEDPRAAEQEHLQEPVEPDGDLAEEVEAVALGRDEHVVDDEQRQRQHGRGAEDVEQVGQRREAPLRLVEGKPPVDEAGEGHEDRQEGRQVLHPLVEQRAVEADHEGQGHGDRRRDEVVDDDERLLEKVFVHGRPRVCRISAALRAFVNKPGWRVVGSFEIRPPTRSPHRRLLASPAEQSGQAP